MKKNKISVKPYLNKRIQPVSITFTENGKNITVKLYPIYYQVIYKRKNTQFRTAYFKNGNEAFSHFFSLEESKYNQSDPQKVIENDKIIIEQIIRYLELMDEEFSLKGLNKKYDEYTIELAILINKILNSYIKHKLKMEKPNLYEERMDGQGGAYQNRQNYLKGLDDMCKFHGMNKDHIILELGVNDGVSTSLFSHYCKEVIAIDLISTGKLERKLKENPNIIFKKGDIKEIIPGLPDLYFDFVYIDANHDKEFVLGDINISLPKLKDSGIICGHDYISSKFEGVVRVAT